MVTGLWQYEELISQSDCLKRRELQVERTIKPLDYSQCSDGVVKFLFMSMEPQENGSDIKAEVKSDNIIVPRLRSCGRHDRGVPIRSDRGGIKYLTRARSRCVSPCDNKGSVLKAMKRKLHRSVSDLTQPRVRRFASVDIKENTQEKDSQANLPRDYNTSNTRSESQHKDYVHHASTSSVDLINKSNDVQIEECGHKNIDRRRNEHRNTFTQHLSPVINNLTSREWHEANEIKTRTKSDLEVDEEKTLYIRYRTPSISPVLGTSLTGEDSRPSPSKEFAGNSFPTSSDSQAKQRPSNFSISAILGRVSSTPKKEMSVSSADTSYSSRAAQESVYSTHVQDSVCQTHMTCNQLRDGGWNRKVDCGSEENTRPAANIEHSSSSCSSCGSCQQSASDVTRRKMERTKFPKEHIQILTESFWKEPYPSSLEIEKLAQQLGHRSLQIKTWFQNKRASVSGTRRPKGQASCSNLTFQPDHKTPPTVLFPVPHSMINNFINQHHMLPRLPAPGGGFVTPANTFASLAGHAYPLTTSAYIVPQPGLGSVTSNPYIVPQPPMGSIPSSQYPPYPHLPSFHYFGSGF